MPQQMLPEPIPRCTGPLSMFAAGTRAVAEGDFRPVKDYSGRDELGMLTQSFNAMTRQLNEARSMVERNLDRATILFAILFVANTILMLKI